MLLRARDWSIRACAFNFLTQYAAIMPKSRSLSLCSSRRRKLSLQSKVSLPPALPPGIYNRDINLPPGIRNGANICYAISVLQCLFNHPTFRDVFEEVCAFHEKQQGSNCFSCGMMLIYSAWHEFWYALKRDASIKMVCNACTVATNCCSYK